MSNDKDSKRITVEGKLASLDYVPAQISQIIPEIPDSNLETLAKSNLSVRTRGFLQWLRDSGYNMRVIGLTLARYDKQFDEHCMQHLFNVNRQFLQPYEESLLRLYSLPTTT